MKPNLLENEIQGILDASKDVGFLLLVIPLRVSLAVVCEAGNGSGTEAA